MSWSCYEKDIMSILHKSKQHDIIDMFYYISRYFDDIFTIDNPAFEKHSPDIHPKELQFNKANTPDKESSLFDLNINVNGIDVYTLVYNKSIGIHIVNFNCLSGDDPTLPSYGVYISQ